MSNVTTIQLPKKVLFELKGVKKYPRQSYAELISEMVKTFKQAKRKNQYDEFLHSIQQRKMKELWDNKEDEAWEKA
jgi:rRNA pseudouridine-1189 N-methylase Emg1 (Nep1/Mra1 family)